jgi:hypothetical protein
MAWSSTTNFTTNPLSGWGSVVCSRAWDGAGASEAGVVFAIGRKAMNDKKTMDDGIQHQETPADEFVDELADEALDRPNESRHCVGGTNYCI